MDNSVAATMTMDLAHLQRIHPLTGDMRPSTPAVSPAATDVELPGRVVMDESDLLPVHEFGQGE